MAPIFTSYPGVGEQARENLRYSQAVQIGSRIECSGQGGWDPDTMEFYKETNAQIDQAFRNCDLNLRHAGGQGWSQVVKVNSYHLPLNKEAIDAMVRNFKEWMPNHQPIWTCIGVQRLGEDDMRVEIEVVAIDEDGKPVAS